MLTDDEAAELAALRVRAYGADADLGDDPEGLARLQALEDQARGVVEAHSGEMDADEPTNAEPPVDAAGVAGGDPSVRAEPPHPSPEEPVPVSAPRPSWRRRTVLAVGIPLIVVACALTAGVAAGLTSAGDTAWSRGSLPAQYADLASNVSQSQNWDTGSLHLLADISGSLVWTGTTANGSMTCIFVVGREATSSACGETKGLTTSGIGVGQADSQSGEFRTYTVWPGSPFVTYSTDRDQSGHLFDCPECTGSNQNLGLNPNSSVTIPFPESTGG